MSKTEWIDIGEIKTTLGKTYQVEIRKNGGPGKVFLNRVQEVANLNLYLTKLKRENLLKKEEIDWKKMAENF